MCTWPWRPGQTREDRRWGFYLQAITKNNRNICNLRNPATTTMIIAFCNFPEDILIIYTIEFIYSFVIRSRVRGHGVCVLMLTLMCGADVRRAGGRCVYVCVYANGSSIIAMSNKARMKSAPCVYDQRVSDVCPNDMSTMLCGGNAPHVGRLNARKHHRARCRRRRRRVCLRPDARRWPSDGAQSKVIRRLARRIA